MFICGTFGKYTSPVAIGVAIKHMWFNIEAAVKNIVYED